MSVSKKRRLIKTTALYAVANLGTKFLSFVIVPLYTHYLAPDKLGQLDLILTTIALVQPLVLFQLNDAVIRWMLDESQDPARVIPTALRIVVRNIAIGTLLYGVAWGFLRFDNAIVMVGIFVADSFGLMLQQIARGSRRNVLYAFSGVVSTVGFLGLAVWFVVIQRLGLEGMLMARMLSSFMALVLLLVSQWKMLRSTSARGDSALAKEMLQYSIPLIPNTINWWALNFLDRYIVLVFLGAYSLGLYALASKFSGMLLALASLFNLAWQESAISEHGSADQDAFYGSVLRRYYTLLILSAAVLAPATRLVIVHLLDARYAATWQYTSLLYLGAIFSALASFWGIGYQTTRRTSGALYTTLFGAAVAVLMNLALVSSLSLYGVAIADFLGFLALFVVRVVTMRRYFTIHLDVRHLIRLFAYVAAVMTASQFLSDSVQWPILIVASGVFLLHYARDARKALLYLMRRWRVEST